MLSRSSQYRPFQPASVPQVVLTRQLLEVRGQVRPCPSPLSHVPLRVNLVSAGARPAAGTGRGQLGRRGRQVRAGDGGCPRSVPRPFPQHGQSSGPESGFGQFLLRRGLWVTAWPAPLAVGRVSGTGAAGGEVPARPPGAPWPAGAGAASALCQLIHKAKVTQGAPEGDREDARATLRVPTVGLSVVAPHRAGREGRRPRETGASLAGERTTGSLSSACRHYFCSFDGDP